MVDLCGGYMRLAFAVVPLMLAAPVVQADVVDLFPGAGTVRVADGTTGRVVGVTSVNRAAGTVGAVIDARDRFGNSVRVNRVLKVVPEMVARFGRTCLSPAGAARCAAVGAITAAAAYAGYDLVNGWFQRPATESGECASDWIFLTDSNGTLVKTLPGLPCIEKKSNYWVYKSPGPSGAADAWRSPDVQPTVQKEVFYTTWGDQTTPIPGDIWSYKRTWAKTDVQAEPATSGEISDAEFSDLVLSDPASLQIEPGVYPDIFEPISIEETATQPGEGTDIQPELDPETATDLITVDEVPRDVIDLRLFYDWGDGWLPRQCPAATQIPVLGEMFSMDYGALCQMIEGTVAPVLRLLAIFGFLSIVIVGVGRNG